MRKVISKQMSFADGFIDASLYELDEELKKDFSVRFILRHGFGDNKPISGNKTTEGRTKNWRVKIELH